jgi:hypothetical protein
VENRSWGDCLWKRGSETEVPQTSEVASSHLLAKWPVDDGWLVNDAPLWKALLYWWRDWRRRLLMERCVKARGDWNRWDWIRSKRSSPYKDIYWKELDDEWPDCCVEEEDEEEVVDGRESRREKRLKYARLAWAQASANLRVWSDGSKVLASLCRSRCAKGAVEDDVAGRGHRTETNLCEG